MGYDCTLHVVDEKAIRERFVPRLLGRSQGHEPFDERPDAEKMWNIIQGALAGEAGEDGNPPRPSEVATMVGLMTLAYSSAELPYHYERGFCLSLWPSLPQEPIATVPKKYVGNPESLFPELVQAHHRLKGEFSQEIEGNGCTGLYVPAERVPDLLKWMERRVKRFAKPDQRLFRGLLLVLKEAAERGMAYWEGTEVPVPMATILPPEAQRRSDLEEWKGPEGFHFRLVGRSGPVLVLLDAIHFENPHTLFVDLSTWPPEVRTINEYVACAACSRKGRWVRISRTNPKESYQIRISKHSDGEASVLPLEDVKTNLWVDFVGEQVVTVRDMGKSFDERCLVPLIQEGEGLVPMLGLLEKHKTVGCNVIRLPDGSDVFCWKGNGYEPRAGRFDQTFTMEGAYLGHGEHQSVPFGPDGFFFIKEVELFSVQRGQQPVPHLRKLKTNLQGISAGPDGAVLLKEGPNRFGDLGELYFPGEDAYIRLLPELYEDEDPGEVLALQWVPECGRLVAVTSKRLWAVPISSVLSLPRYRASTGRKIRS